MKIYFVKYLQAAVSVMRNVDKNWNSLDDDTETCNESVAMFD